MKERKAAVDRESTVSVRRQCQLLKVNRNRLDPPPPKLSAEDVEICARIDRIHLEHPAYGARKIRDILRLHDKIRAGRKRIGRLMKHMGIEAVYPRPRTSLPGSGEEHKVYPYLLKEGVKEADEAWCADI